MKGLGVMLLSGSAFALAITCQGCVLVNTASAQERIDERVNDSAAAFATSTALPGAFGSGPLAPARLVSVSNTTSAPNSFSQPLYGAPAPAAFAATAPLASRDGAAIAARKQARATAAASEWTGSEAIRSYKAERKAARLAEPLEMEQDFAGELSFDALRADTGFNFDVGVAPRFSVVEEGAFSTRSVGAEVRIGQSFSGGAEAPRGWYMFAGADGEALVWEAGDKGFSDITGAMGIRDQITVGDVQAGFAVHRGGGQLSLSYIRREVEYSDRNGSFSETEDFAGVSFTYKH